MDMISYTCRNPKIAWRQYNGNYRFVNNNNVIFKFKISVLLHKKIHITTITSNDSPLVHSTEFIGLR